MTRVITERELRQQSGQILCALERGESFTVTRNGLPVGELNPVRTRRMVDRDAVLTVFAGTPEIDHVRLRVDLDGVVGPDLASHG